MNCPTCGNRAPETSIYRCAGCGQVYCVTRDQTPRRATGCHRHYGCPRCSERRAFKIGESALGRREQVLAGERV